MVDINEYLNVFKGGKTSDKISETELNNIILNIIPDGLSNQAYVQVFNCETITKNICEHI